MQYQSPRLDEVAAKVRAELDRRGASIAVVVFWGRERYVRILVRCCADAHWCRERRVTE